MRPFKEVILFSNLGNRSALSVDENTKYKLKESTINILWRGSKDKFKNDFEIPEDAPLSTKDTELSDGNRAEFVKFWNWTTLNFKFNYQVWYKDNSTNFYVNGSNHTVNLTIPNVLIFDGNIVNNEYIEYATNNDVVRAYNPNLFPLPISITSFVTSNKVSDFQNIQTNSGTDSICYLVFRYGVGGDDIQICLLTKDSNNFQINTKPLIIPYASLTFTGFNKVKRLT